jgi:hypothetical protein
MDELMLILETTRKLEDQNRIFLAAIQGIDLENNDKGDITELKGIHAEKDGFGIGLGLGYESEGE